jgi:putative ABC transport system permease protein
MFEGKRERELDEEIQAHLRLAEQDRIRQGESPQEAAVSARRELGNVILVKERTRDAWGWIFLDRLLQDTRFAIRNFARNPPATAIIVFTLAAGIGANTAVFSIFDAVLLRQPPYRDPGHLVSILDLQKKAGGRAVFFDLYTDYENWKRNSKMFDGFAAYTWAGSLDRTLSGAGPARRVPVMPVTADYFSIFGVPPLLGRTFQESDEDRGCRIVLSDEFWRTINGGQESLIGKTLRLDDQDCEVIGVMPHGFAVYPNPASMIWALMPSPKRPDQFAVFVIGRMKLEVSIAQAQRELMTLHYQFHQHDRWGELMEPRVYALQSEFTWLTGKNISLSLMVLLGAVSVVLVICCANVFNLLLGQTLTRRREIAIRAAFGSGRTRILRQLLTESLLLAAAAAVIGVVLAGGAVNYFRISNPIELPPTTVVEVDYRIPVFTILLSTTTALLFGLVPAWRASRTDLNAALKASGHSTSEDAGSHRIASFLIIAEVALTLVLLSGAGLLIRSVNRFGSAPLGFEAEGLLTSRIQLPQAAYAKPEQRIRFYSNLLDQLRSTREVEEATLSTALPTGGTGPVAVMAVEGKPDPGPDRTVDSGMQTVSSEYFRVMRLPLKEGRFFDDRDRADSEQVVIVNEALVARYFPGEDPIRRHIRPFDGPETQGPWLRIVGIVGNEKRTAVASEMSWTDTPVLYRPWPQDTRLSSVLLFRVRQAGLPLISLIQRASGDPSVSVGEIETMTHAVEKILAYPRFRAAVLAAFATLALVLAVVGLYGVLSRLVARRTHEIGIRIALGATRGQVVRMVARQGLRLTVTGIIFGLASVWGLTRLLRALLYGVSAMNSANLILTTLVLLCSAGIATLMTARRATRIDPTVALRDE